MNEFIVELQAKLDEAKSKGNINNDINTLQEQINKLKIQAEIDPKTAQKLASDIGKLVNQKITISNIEVDTKSGIKAGENYGKQFSKGVSDGLKDNEAILNTFKKSLENMGMGSKEIDKVAERVKNLNLQIESLTQSISHQKGKESEKDILSVGIAGIDQMGQAIKLTEQYDKANGDLIKSIDAVSTAQKKADTATDNFIKKQKRMLSNKQNTINQITSNALDKNASNPITSEESLGKLNAQTTKIEKAMDSLRNSTADTFDDAVLKVNEEISAFKILEKELRNADNVSSKQKDFSTIKIDEGNKLDAFVQKMEQSGHYTDELKNKVTTLRTDLSNVFDENSLTNYLKGLNSLENEFKKVDATAKTSEKTAKESNQLVENLAKSYQTIKNLEEKKEALNVSKDINRIAELDEQIKTAKKDFDSLFTQTNANNNFDISEWNERKTAIDSTTRSQIEYNKAKQEDILYSSLNKTTDNLNKLKSAWQEQGILVGDFKTKVEELEKELSSVGNQNELDSLKSKIEILKTEATQISEINDIKFSMDNGYGASEYQNRINSIISSLEKYGIETKEAQTITSSLQSTFDSMKGMSGQELITQADKLEQEFKAVKASVDQAKLSYDKLMQPASNEKITSTLINVQKLLSNNTKVTTEVKNEWQSYVNRLSSGSDIAIKEINDINLRLKETESNMRGINKLGLSWTDKLKQAWEKFGGWGFATGTMMTLFNQLRQIPQEVIKVNSAMVELNKVSNASATDIKNYFDEAAESAKRYGSSVSDMINATADWSRLGYNLPDAKKLAEVATLYKNVGDGIDIDTANESLVSTLQGFQLEAEDAMGIIDRFNEVNLLAS